MLDAGASVAATTVARRRLGGADWIVLACLALAAALAWAWLLAPAASEAAMGGIAMNAAPAPWSAAYLGPAFAMWALMMVAMMLPSASPMILLHARVARHGGGGPLPAATLAFALAYLALWIAFAAFATFAQAALVAAGAVAGMSVRLGSATASALVLVLAAAYNLTPAKSACLDRCRSPLGFVMHRWRPGLAGAIRMGLAHGLFCLGCCWLLMALLFVGGVMNPAWIALLAAVVLAEKYGPPWTSRAVAGLLAAAAVVVLVRQA